MSKDYMNYSKPKTEEPVEAKEVKEEVVAEEKPAKMKEMHTTDLLNLRSKPDMDAEILEILNPEEKVMVKPGDEVNGFVAVKHNDLDGWCKAEFLN